MVGRHRADLAAAGIELEPAAARARDPFLGPQEGLCRRSPEADEPARVHEGDLPHHAVGCIAQAWSVAELLRATVEDIYDIRPGTVETGNECSLRA